MNLMIQAYFRRIFTVYLESLENNGVYVSPPICIFILFFLEMLYILSHDFKM